MRRALGKGLAQLLGEQSESQVTELPVGSIDPNPHQPRTHFDEDALQELAESIRQVGIIQPIVVRVISEGRYGLIAGERRWRAAQIAGLTDVPVVVRSVDEQSTLQLGIIENVQRQDISALEQAAAFRRLMDEFNLSQENIAGAVGKSRTAVANTLRLLRLPREVQQALLEGLISEGHGRALLGCETEDQLKTLFYKIVDEGLSVREAERHARRQPPVTKAKKAASAKSKTITRDPNWASLEEALSIYLGSPTELTRTESGGRISVEFYSDDDLERILEVLGVRL